MRQSCFENPQVTNLHFLKDRHFPFFIVHCKLLGLLSNDVFGADVLQLVKIRSDAMPKIRCKTEEQSHFIPPSGILRLFIN